MGMPKLRSVTQEANIRRVTISYDDAKQGWVFKVQGHNWRVLYDAPFAFASDRACVRYVMRRFPEGEVVVLNRVEPCS